MAMNSIIDFPSEHRFLLRQVSIVDRHLLLQIAA
jgi:hypothetical protein